ncbi:hypothetical protein IX51_06005 [uncultured archaeon]|nr:hypothetical protein IX51_06005 [uncultured archaeon]
MPKSKHYPPSYIRYQIEHPPVTVHLSKKVKENLDALKGNRSYAEVINEILDRTFNLEHEIKRLPVNEAVISYHRGFREAESRYAQWGVCKKCGREWTLWKDGKCDLCHKEGSSPDYSYFRDSESTKVVNEEDFEKAKAKLPRLERLSYENGKKKGHEDGWADGYDEAIEDYRITYPCKVCGKAIVMKTGDNGHKAMIEYMKEHGWSHSSCLK